MYGSVSPETPSIYDASGANNPPYYGPAKAGLIQLTRYAACHLASSGIRVNCISPGPFPAAQFLERDPEFGNRLSAKVPRYDEPAIHGSCGGRCSSWRPMRLPMSPE